MLRGVDVALDGLQRQEAGVGASRAQQLGTLWGDANALKASLARIADPAGNEADRVAAIRTARSSKSEDTRRTLLALVAGLLQFAATGGSYPLLAVAVVYGVGQVLESFILTPRLVGERIGLHPLVVIFALLAFGQLLGFVGVLIALPASAVLLVALRRLRQRYFASRLYMG